MLKSLISKGLIVPHRCGLGTATDGSAIGYDRVVNFCYEVQSD